MRKKIKVGIIGSVGVPAKYGGFETLVHYLVKHLAGQFDLRVYCSGEAYKKEERLQEWEGARLHYIGLKANGPQSVAYDILSMLHALRTCEVLLVLGVSGCVLLPVLRLVFPQKFIINIDGLEWRREKWGKFARMFLKFSERQAAHFAHRIITDNRALQEYVAGTYHSSSELIAYGGDHVGKVEIDASLLPYYPFLGRNYAVKVARAEPENKLEMILEAFSQYNQMDLVIVSNWDSTRHGRALRARFGHFEHIHLVDYIQDLRILDMLRSNATLYLHGHSAGGTNPSLVEAMNLGRPILAYDVVFNRETTANEALFFQNTQQLLQHLQQLSPRKLQQLGKKMKSLALKHYTWEVVAQQYARTIRQVCAGPVFSTQPELGGLPRPAEDLPDSPI